jgi:hypothetical protein
MKRECQGAVCSQPGSRAGLSPWHSSVRGSAWHPQGPIHSTPPPRATTCRLAPTPSAGPGRRLGGVVLRNVVARGGWVDVDGPLWMPGRLPRRRLHGHCVGRLTMCQGESHLPALEEAVGQQDRHKAQYISLKRPSCFVMLSAAKHLRLVRDASLRSA